ncbi:MAG: hypothetical protein N2376_00795 [Clostridia bacterium]|nr:hypothetical protein [Clostridia bacterium]
MNEARKIKSYIFKNWLGITEIQFEPGKVNLISGHKGAGKTSILEGIEQALSGRVEDKENRGGLSKTELIRHGEKEATLFIQLDDGLTVERKIRADSTDYLKVSKAGMAVPSTETFLRSLFKGDIFKPGEFLKKKADEQASIILNMLEIPWSMNDICSWFGEIPDGINYSMHILQILKQIEDKFYKERTAVNHDIDVLKAQARGYRDQLPPNYDGEEWRDKKVQEYYAKVSEAQEINRKIQAAKSVIETLESKISALRSDAEIDKQIKRSAYDRMRGHCRESIQNMSLRMEKAQQIVEDAERRVIEADHSLENELAAEIEKLKGKYAQLKSIKREEIRSETDNAKSEITACKSSISAKEQELISIDALEQQALSGIDEKLAEQIKAADAAAGNSKKILEETVPIDVAPLQQAADEVANMQSYLRDFDLMKDILVTKLAPKQEHSAALTAKIEKARSLPLELLKVSKCPIEGITVDEQGLLRINGTLISGLSTGEKRDLAIRIAKKRAESGELKIICFDGFQDLNPSEQAKIIEEAQNDGFQWFFLRTDDGDLKIEIIDAEG